MAIRIRKLSNGLVVALCAAISDSKEDDLYLDDAMHHALTTKFGLDFQSEGLMKESLADEVLIPFIRQEQNGRLI